MSLVAKNHELTNGFSTMDTDELFFINGGSGSGSSSGNGATITGLQSPTAGQYATWVAVYVGYSLVTLGNAPDNFAQAADVADSVAGIHNGYSTQSTSSGGGGGSSK